MATHSPYREDPKSSRNMLHGILNFPQDGIKVCPLPTFREDPTSIPDPKLGLHMCPLFINTLLHELSATVSGSRLALLN